MAEHRRQFIRIMLAGDVMLGRGVDQLYRTHCPPHLFEPCVRHAAVYVALAERASGTIARPVSPSYVWGDALADMRHFAPDARIINLETSITTSESPEDKGINYRMHPDNTSALQAAKADIAIVANNHVMDWGLQSLLETLDNLANAGIAPAGAGRTVREAVRPVVLPLPAPARGHTAGEAAPGATAGASAPHGVQIDDAADGSVCAAQQDPETRTAAAQTPRVVLFAAASPSAGVPARWAAEAACPGVALVCEWTREGRDGFVRTVQEQCRNHHVHHPGDVVIVSLHMGSNWGYEVPQSQRDLAHALIDTGVVDIVYAHSSHHPRPVEVYKGKCILYGCGDLINDYEGIEGHEEYRGELSALYLTDIDVNTGELQQLTLVPYRIHRMRLQRANEGEARWMAQTLTQASHRYAVAPAPAPRFDVEMVAVPDAAAENDAVPASGNSKPERQAAAAASATARGPCTTCTATRPGPGGSDTVGMQHDSEARARRSGHSTAATVMRPLIKLRRS